MTASVPTNEELIAMARAWLNGTLGLRPGSGMRTRDQWIADLADRLAAETARRKSAEDALRADAESRGLTAYPVRAHFARYPVADMPEALRRAGAMPGGGLMPGGKLDIV